jgi:hypothetical protein
LFVYHLVKQNSDLLRHTDLPWHLPSPAFTAGTFIVDRPRAESSTRIDSSGMYLNSLRQLMRKRR